MADSDVIRIKCPNLSCQRVLAVPTHARGKLVKCRNCAMTIRIPQAGSKKPAQPANQEGSEDQQAA